MSFAVSNIAWPVELDEQAALLLQTTSVSGVELAPTRLWPDLSGWSSSEARAYGSFWTDHGLDIVAIQAMLFGRPDLTVFGHATERQRTLDYLGHAIDIAACWGAGVLVFGSPKNRRVGELDSSRAAEQARDFFEQLAERASHAGCVIGLEPNPPEYGCDFLTRSEEVIEFVESIGHPGLACHLDLGGMILSGEDPAAVIQRASTVAHFHASEPYLEPLGSHREMHVIAGRALRRHGYGEWVSIEMRTDADDPIGSVERAIRLVEEVYAPAGEQRS